MNILIIICAILCLIMSCTYSYNYGYNKGFEDMKDAAVTLIKTLQAEKGEENKEDETL